MYKIINAIVAAIAIACMVALYCASSSLNKTTDRLDATADSLAAARQLNDSLASDACILRQRAVVADSARQKAESSLADMKNKGKEFRLIAVNPTVKKCSAGRELTIDKLTIGPEGTSVKLTFWNSVERGKAAKGNTGRAYIWSWAHIERETYIVAQGRKYKMTRADGIEEAPRTTDVTRKDHLTFTLHFPVIPSSTKEIDLVEPGSDWKLYGISLR